MNNAENVFINLEKSIDEQLFQVEVLNYFLNHSIKYFKNSSKFYINFKTNTFTDYQGKENNIGPLSLLFSLFLLITVVLTWLGFASFSLTGGGWRH